MGIPSGLRSVLPGLGIQTLRVGLDFPVILSLVASFIRSVGGSDFIPSTPAVFFPWFNWQTLRTAKILFLQDLINVLWSLRTSLTFPLREAA